MRYEVSIEVNLCSINGICNCYKLLGGYWCKQPPAAKDVQRTRPSLRYLDAIIQCKNLPCILGISSALIWSRKQFLYTILTCIVHVPPQRVLTDGPSDTTPETKSAFLSTPTDHKTTQGRINGCKESYQEREHDPELLMLAQGASMVNWFPFSTHEKGRYRGMSRAELKGNAHGISGQANMIGTTRASLSLSSQRKERFFPCKRADAKDGRTQSTWSGSGVWGEKKRLQPIKKSLSEVTWLGGGHTMFKKQQMLQHMPAS